MFQVQAYEIFLMWPLNMSIGVVSTHPYLEGVYASINLCNVPVLDCLTCRLYFLPTAGLWYCASELWDVGVLSAKIWYTLNDADHYSILSRRGDMYLLRPGAVLHCLLCCHHIVLMEVDMV